MYHTVDIAYLARDKQNNVFFREIPEKELNALLEEWRKNNAPTNENQ